MKKFLLTTLFFIVIAAYCVYLKNLYQTNYNRFILEFSAPTESFFADWGTGHTVFALAMVLSIFYYLPALFNKMLEQSAWIEKQPRSDHHSGYLRGMNPITQNDPLKKGALYIIGKGLKEVWGHRAVSLAAGVYVGAVIIYSINKAVIFCAFLASQRIIPA